MALGKKEKNQGNKYIFKFVGTMGKTDIHLPEDGLQMVEIDSAISSAW